MTPNTLQCGAGADSFVTDVILTSGSCGSDSTVQDGRAGVADPPSTDEASPPPPHVKSIAAITPNADLDMNLPPHREAAVLKCFGKTTLGTHDGKCRLWMRKGP
jgi:hypothetical protein